ncbi:MAG: KOW domain-containing RNA-binding protein [Oscillospiraceae bacterium]|nr:KOW domain-containing RNA-binding protein [Oscillospiraceae bacterium]
MDIEKSNIVRSGAGRDKGKLFVVLAVEGDYLLLADGKSRKLEAPKRKKRRHVLFVAAADENRLSKKIRGEEKITNSELRRALAAYRDAQAEQEG